MEARERVSKEGSDAVSSGRCRKARSCKTQHFRISPAPLSFQKLPPPKDTCKSIWRCYDFRMASFGYARVSTDGQSVDAQVRQLRDAGAEKIFPETASGRRPTGANWREVFLTRLRDGDTLLVTRLDRLARSTRSLSNILATIAKAGAGFRSLGDAWADTTAPHGRLMLTVLGGLAEFERELSAPAPAKAANAPRREAFTWDARRC